MVATNDWRLQGQEAFLKGVRLTWQAYAKYRPGWDHDHCAFCQTKFMEPGTPDTTHAGYATDDRYHWVCKTCFEDFKDRFQW